MKTPTPASKPAAKASHEWELRLYVAGPTPKSVAAFRNLERMCEEHLYWGLIQARWLDDSNFRKGPAVFFRAAPAPLRPLIQTMVRRGLRRTLREQGLGRHSAAEVTELMRRDLAAIADVLGEQDYLYGSEPRGVDATVAAFIAGCLCATFDSPVRDAAAALPTLVAYSARMMARFYPHYAGEPAA